MGGIVVEIRGFKETTKWCGHSTNVASFLSMSGIEIVSDGDDHDGTIIFDPIDKQIIIKSDYFSLSRDAIKFWRNIGFDIVLAGETDWEE